MQRHYVNAMRSNDKRDMTARNNCADSWCCFSNGIRMNGTCITNIDRT